MANSNLIYREILQKHYSTQWKGITISSDGGLNSADLKSTEFAGGYTYRDSSRLDSICRNRSIYWRIYQDTLELVEQSLDADLTGNCVCVRFANSQLIDGAKIHESHDHVYVLVATTSSVHRLIFVHPSKLQDVAFHQSATNTTVLSIFNDVSLSTNKYSNNSHSINTIPGLSYQLTTMTSALTSECEAMFALATHSGNLLLVKMPPPSSTGTIIQHELKQSTMMQRLWTGLVPSVIRGGESMSCASSLLILPLGSEHFIFATSYDHKLKMWSCKTQECVMAVDLLEFVPDNLDSHTTSVRGGGHLLRCCLDGANRVPHIAVYLNFSDRNQFTVLQPCIQDGRYQLLPITNMFANAMDLIDFQLTPTQLWTLWTDKNGETIARVAQMQQQGSHSDDWLSVVMETPVKSQIDVPSHLDPREYYVNYLFFPGRFSTRAIIKALKIYQRSLDQTMSSDLQIPTDVLKTEVTDAVVMEIQNVALECELSEEEYVQLQMDQWSRLYASCVEYEKIGNKCVGLSADSNTGLVTIIKKNCASYIRPCSTLEHLYFADPRLLQSAKFNPVLQSLELCNDMLTVVDCMKQLSSCLNAEMLYAFTQDIHYTQNPRIIAESIIDNLLSSYDNSQDTISIIATQLNTVKDLNLAMTEIVQMLDMSQSTPENMDQNTGEVIHKRLRSSNLFRSRIGADVLCDSVRQSVEFCFDLSRDLLMLCTLITKFGQQSDLKFEDASSLSSDLIRSCSSMTQVYYLLFWVTQHKATQVTASILESSCRQLEVVQLAGNSRNNIAHKLAGQWCTLLQLFLYGDGGTLMRTALSDSDHLEDEPCAIWTSLLNPAVTSILQLLWPIGINVTLAEFLLYQCQYSAIQEYVRLCADWCEWNCSTNKFFLAMALLNTNESHKALDIFLETIHDCGSEDFLLRMVQTEQTDYAHCDANLYLIIIELLEMYNLPELIVDLATTAIDKAQSDDPNVATLWSKLFKHQLALDHNDEAYAAMIANPDPSRRKDCLRQFLVVLCDRGELQQLVEFSYTDLQDDVINIVESRARTVDLTTHNYYDLLYAFHIYRGNYRKASSVMYECGRRVACEVLGLIGLQRQAKCYLAAINCLRLVNCKYAWIVQPAESVISSLRERRHSVKHGLNGEHKDEPSHPQLSVLELDHLDKEYMLVHARLCLLQNDPDPAHMIGPTSSAEETVARLVGAGFLDNAINLCTMFELPFTSVFESLTAKCIQLSQIQNDPEYAAVTRVWLDHNEINATTTANLSNADFAWRLLKHYLELHETSETQYYKCVTRRLLTQGFTLPNWLTEQYKKSNAAELLRLYLDYDLLIEAAQLALEYVDALLGKGPEFFGLKTGLQVGSSPVWLPYNSIDQLCQALEEVTINKTCIHLSDQLNDKLREYFSVVESVSKDAIQQSVSRQSAQNIQPQSAQNIQPVLMMES